MCHSNVSQLIDAGVSTLGQPYPLIEHVVAERVRLILDVLASVAFAHSNLLVQRDLEPHNLLVTEAGEVKLLDFRVAKLVEAIAEAQSSHFRKWSDDVGLGWMRQTMPGDRSATMH